MYIYIYIYTYTHTYIYVYRYDIGFYLVESFMWICGAWRCSLLSRMGWPLTLTHCSSSNDV